MIDSLAFGLADFLAAVSKQQKPSKEGLMMRELTILFVMLFSGEVIGVAQPQSAPPDGERMAIYRAFLTGYTNGEPKANLNIAQTTIGFNANDSDRKGCLSEFSDSDLKAVTPEAFATDAFPQHHLVDPKTYRIRDPGDAIKKGESVDSAVTQGFAHAIFTFSGIVFDHAHRLAAFSYSFHCGSLCGHGGVVIFEKTDGSWHESKRRCGSWIS